MDYNLIKWKDHFELDASSPSGLIRKDSVVMPSGYVKYKAGSSCGSKSCTKEGKPLTWIVRFQNRNYMAHRIIWVLLNGSIDQNLVIDHLDGNAFNNTITNLELKTKRANAQNMCKRRTSTCDKGYYLRTRLNGSTSWVAHWCDIDRNPRSKSFSVLKYGFDTAREFAKEYRDKQMKLLNKMGMDYTERHLLT